MRCYSSQHFKERGIKASSARMQTQGFLGESTHSHKFLGSSRQQREKGSPGGSFPFPHIRGSYSELLLGTTQGEMQVR